VTRLASVRLAFPDHRYGQSEISSALVGAMPSLTERAARQASRIHGASGVDHRNVAMPLERYARLADFTEANSLWLEEGHRLAERAAKEALDAAGVQPQDVDVLMFITVTGLSTPSMDARLIDSLGLRRDVKRIPIFGLGCVAGASGLARMHDALSGSGGSVGLLIAVELCSLTVQRDDTSLPNIIASGLFGDGVAALVMTRDSSKGQPGQHPVVVDSLSHVLPNSEDILGWNIGSFGFRIVLSASLSDLVRNSIADQVDTLLQRHALSRNDIGTWISHTGGPKVIEAIEQALDLDPQALRHTRASLAERGNLSSVSVLDVLHRTLQDTTPSRGDHGVLMAMGPGFSIECVLLRWEGHE
jgi:alkylresorcinol/alkylpyrone synthase